MDCYLTNHNERECWGPFTSVPKAWAYLLGWDPTDPKRCDEGTKEVNRHHDAGWTVNDHEVYPVINKNPVR
jgi:hypothetical protein